MKLTTRSTLFVASLSLLHACADAPKHSPRDGAIDPTDSGDLGVDGALDNVCPGPPVASATPSAIEVGMTLGLHGAALDADGLPSPLHYAWASDGGTLASAGSADATLTCTTAGTVHLTLMVTDGACPRNTSIDVACTPHAAVVVINEIETSGGTPGDWLELFNPTDDVHDISGWIVRDSDDGHTYAIPNGTVLASHAYYVVEEASLGFGFGTADSARLFDTTHALVDSKDWTAHAMTTLGRCPDGSGDFTVTVASTKGATNTCTGTGAAGLTYTTWPGADDVVVADAVSTFAGNLSDLTYRAAAGADPAVMFGIQNDPSRMHRIVATGGVWGPDSGDWAAGKAIHYPNGLGSPDAEGITFAESSSQLVYVVAERDNEVPTTSRLSVLLFDTTTSGASMTPTHEWNLTSDFAVVGPNAGIESITWIPDTYLVADGFYDEHASATYVPSVYPDHGAGLFLIALETGGVVHAYALDHVSETFTRVATITTGMMGMMGMSFDRDVGFLWAHCDDACSNRSAVLRIDTTPASPTLGRFVLHGSYERPASLGNYGYEGIVVAPESECTASYKRVFFADDALTDGHAIRVGTIPCGAFP